MSHKLDDDDERYQGEAKGGRHCCCSGMKEDKAEDHPKPDRKDSPPRYCDSSKPDEVPDIVHRVSKYFFEDDLFASIFETWVQDRASIIDLSTDECRLEYSDLHEDFKKKFEDTITEYIESQGSTVSEFYEQVAKKSEDDPWSEESVFAQILVATTDFDIFMQMMREAALQARMKNK